MGRPLQGPDRASLTEHERESGSRGAAWGLRAAGEGAGQPHSGEEAAEGRRSVVSECLAFGGLPLDGDVGGP